MGFYEHAYVARGPVQHGMPPSAKVCVVHWGTLARQRSVDGTLADIVGRVRSAKLAPPCMIIIGDVVGLRPRLGKAFARIR